MRKQVQDLEEDH